MGFAVITNGTTGGIDCRVKCSVGNDAAIPHPFDKFVLADDPVSVFDQELQQAESLRFKGDWLRSIG